ncbi:MAG: hypothetical protein KAS32_22010, partial [Candidatus Peribacteraceae bacterium]|nr:hypothetical protein [Candidatus Peribacteraceae bacterium]
MSTLLQYRTDLETMLSSANLSGFFDDAMKNQWINLAGRRVCNFTSWDWLNHAFTTESELTEYYVTPDAFKKNTVFRITMEDADGIEHEYDIIPWNLYKEHKQSETDEKVASILKNQYFLYPTPTVVGLDIGVY